MVSHDFRLISQGEAHQRTARHFSAPLGLNHSALHPFHPCLHSRALPCTVCNEIWEVKGGAVTRWRGDIVGYKEHLRQTHDALMNRKDLG